MDQSVDPRLHLDEGAERSQVADLAADSCPGRILLGQGQPGILLRLLHSEGDLLFVRVDSQHDSLDLFADTDQL